METKLGHKRMCVVGIYEALGTALFTYCIIVSTANPVAAALGLFAMIVIFGSVTGGHFNPAVTIGVFMWQLAKSNPIKNILFAIVIIIA